MKLFIVALLLGLALAVYATPADNLKLQQSTPRQLFSKFLRDHKKIYRNKAETTKRFRIFKKNLDMIQYLNEAEAEHGATYGINQFSDLSPEEFRHHYLMPNFVPKTKAFKEANSKLTIDTTVEAPTSYSWRSKGAVTPVKNQGQCGSCWAFSTAEAIESAWFLAGHSLPGLSEQQIVDCDNSDDGCNGGDPPTAYQYVISTGGLESEQAYPYDAENGYCNFQSSDVVAKISSWTYITQSDNLQTMMNGIATTGPFSICVDASSWQYYNGGIITSNCGQQLDHCVQLTGYDNSGTAYWEVRNSWGTSWGESGYLRVAMQDDLCGIGDEVTWPLVN